METPIKSEGVRDMHSSLKKTIRSCEILLLPGQMRVIWHMNQTYCHKCQVFCEEPMVYVVHWTTILF